MVLRLKAKPEGRFQLIIIALAPIRPLVELVVILILVVVLKLIVLIWVEVTTWSNESSVLLVIL